MARRFIIVINHSPFSSFCNTTHRKLHRVKYHPYIILLQWHTRKCIYHGLVTGDRWIIIFKNVLNVLIPVRSAKKTIVGPKKLLCFTCPTLLCSRFCILLRWRLHSVRAALWPGVGVRHGSQAAELLHVLLLHQQLAALGLQPVLVGAQDMRPLDELLQLSAQALVLLRHLLRVGQQTLGRLLEERWPHERWPFVNVFICVCVPD